MTDTFGAPTTHKRVARRILLVLGECVALVATMSFVYIVLPSPSFRDPIYVAVQIAISLTIYCGVTVWLFVLVKSRDQIAFLAILLLTFLTTFFILGFAWSYQQLEATDPGSFSEPLSKMSGVYFTIAILSTVGFGDIRPIDDLARGVVTAQMVLGVGLLTTAIGLLTQATRQVTRTPTFPNDTDSARGEQTSAHRGESPPTEN
jgi:voltage-gated potassium channel